MKKIIRKAKKIDLNALVTLYKKVASLPDGIASQPYEIKKASIANILDRALKEGIIFVAIHPENPKKLIGAICGSRIGPLCFTHTLSNLTILVDPDFHGQGIGKTIFQKLLAEAKKKNFARVELFVRESNKKALEMYKKLGFEVEGFAKKRILNSKGKLESDTLMGWVNPDFKSK